MKYTRAVSGGDDWCEILRQQISYYDARAPEYDDWFYRRGRYDRGAEATGRWFAEVDQAASALDALPFDDAEVLELAPGTGLWTQRFLGRVETLTVVDVSAEMVKVAEERLGDQWGDVVFEQADLFEWEPVREYDGVVFCFWISHVPETHLDTFIQKVARSIRRGGFVYFLDSRREHQSTAVDHVPPREYDEAMTRRLDSGEEFTIIKNFWTLADLVDRFNRCGIELRVVETPTFFQFATGTRTGR